MSRLENALRNVTASNGITGGRTSVKCSELVERYPNGIHITGIAQNTYDGRTYYVFTFIEEPNKYFSSGKVLTERTDELLESYDGNIVELNQDLAKEYMELFLSKKKGAKFSYINAGFGGVVPASSFGKKYVDENGETIDAETGEVLNKPPKGEGLFADDDGVPF